MATLGTNTIRVGSQAVTRIHFGSAAVWNSNVAPVALFTSTADSLVVNVNASASFDTGGTIASYAWTFGDGGTATGATATRTYATAGTYTVTLTVTDNKGLTDTVSAPITVVAASTPIYDAFTTTTTDTAKWPSLQQPASQSQANGLLRLTYTNAYTGRRSPLAGINLTGAQSWVEVTMAGTSGTGLSSDVECGFELRSGTSDATAAAWTVGMYTKSGTLTTMTCRLRQNAANSDVNVTITAGHKYWRIRYDAGAILWETSPDRTTWTVRRTVASGAYTIDLTQLQVGLFAGYWGSPSATNNTHWAEYDEVRVAVSSATPVPSFTASPTTGAAPLAVTFTGAGTNTPTSWAWDFGDGTTSTVQSPTHTYSTTGDYPVTLAVTNSAGTNRATSFIHVNTTTPAPQLALFSRAWTTPLAADAPVEDRAAFNGTDDLTFNRAGTTYASRFARLARYHTGSTPVAGYYAYGDNTVLDGNAAPLYIIPTADHPRRLVQWKYNNGTGADAPASDPLQAHFQSVPVPTGPGGERFEAFYGRALEAAGGDQQLTIYDPFTDELWEFWLFAWNATAGRYECGYGGYTANARTAPLVFPNTWGARATSIPLHPGNVLRVEWEQGVIRHPLAVAIPVVKHGFIPPATREDANITWHNATGDGRDAVPEGAWFRLPASYVVNENRYPGNAAKSKFYAMFTRAARDYGIVVVDGTGGTMTFSLESANAVGTPYSPLTTSTLPDQPTYEGGLYYGNQNWLKDFPFEDLVQVKYPPA